MHLPADDWAIRCRDAACSPAPPAYGDPEKGGMNHMSELITFISSYLSTDDEGQGLAEYALILALIAIVAIIALIFLGTQVSGILNTVGQSV
jgi:pilus assembly protein Flp/PilA